jgi:hypothetical protein
VLPQPGVGVERFEDDDGDLGGEGVRGEDGHHGWDLLGWRST